MLKEMKYLRYPISIQTFEKIIEGKYAYVDKTDLVYDLAQENVCFLSRPRRFGKSLLISTLEAYFTGRKELFEGLKIDSLETKWEKYPVFRIDFAGGNFENPNGLDDVLENYLKKWESEYEIINERETFGVRFQNIINKAVESTGKKAVVLIDEYDKPMLDVLGTEQEEKKQKYTQRFLWNI